MTWIYAITALAGAILAGWSVATLGVGTNMMPIPPKVKITKGPYRWMKHPMYVGNTLFLTGLGGLGGGFWNAFAFFTITEMLMRYWIGLEEKK